MVSWAWRRVASSAQVSEGAPWGARPVPVATGAMQTGRALWAFESNWCLRDPGAGRLVLTRPGTRGQQLAEQQPWGALDPADQEQGAAAPGLGCPGRRPGQCGCSPFPWPQPRGPLSPPEAAGRTRSQRPTGGLGGASGIRPAWSAVPCPATHSPVCAFIHVSITYTSVCHPSAHAPMCLRSVHPFMTLRLSVRPLTCLRVHLFIICHYLSILPVICLSIDPRSVYVSVCLLSISAFTYLSSTELFIDSSRMRYPSTCSSVCLSICPFVT